MSWRKTDPFFLPVEKINRERKITGLEKIETDVLETEIIDGGALIVNNKNMMITSNELRIETSANKMIIPADGPIRVSSLSPEFSKIDLSTNGKMDIDINEYGGNQHFIFESREKMEEGLIVKILPYKKEVMGNSLIKIHFYLDITSDKFMPFTIKVMDQHFSIKLNSIHSSLSLVWLPSPSKRWNIGELGFKTTVID